MAGRTIIVAVDNSVHSEIAFKFFAENVYREDEDDVILVHCVDIPRASRPGILIPSPEQTEQIIVGLTANATKMRAKMKQMMKKQNIIGSALIVEGSAGEGIIRVSRQKKVDMIVTGSQGHGIFRRAIYGSVSDYVVHHSRVPVLVCKH